MEQRKEDITRRPLYAYDLPKDILSTLTRKDGTHDETNQDDTNTPTDSTERVVQTKPVGDVGSKSCSLCSVTFHTVEDQKSHVRSDFHNYNLKQKIRGAKAVTEIEFEKLVGDLDESLSGSDSSDTEEDDDGGRRETTLSSLLKKQATISSEINEFDHNPGLRKRTRGSGKPPMIWFSTPTMPKNTCLGIYRAIFTNEEQEKEASINEIVQKKQLSPKPQTKIPVNSEGIPLPEAYKGPHIFMCMIGGGHFAAMVVSLAPRQVKNPQATTGPLTKEAVVLAHKTFHRYTTRRKQGGSQSANDSAKGAAHSAGSSLRRYNEQALTDEVRQLLTSWKGMIDTSELLFIRATGTTNRRTLFGPYDDQVLRQNDPRIRGFPFSTRRATQNELMRSFVELTRVKVLEVDEEALAAKRAAALSAQQSLAAKKEAAAISKPQPKKPTEEEETALLHTSQLQSLIRRSKLPALLSYLQANSLSPNFPFHPKEQNHHAPTPLHLAASLNSKLLIEGLILKAHADPTLPNPEGKTPFDLCGDRTSRDAFRVCRHELPSPSTGYSWETSHVPAPLPRSEAQQRAAREHDEEQKRKAEQKKVDDERMAREEAEQKLRGDGKFSSRGGKGKVVGTAGVKASARELREAEMRDMTPEMKMRVERERRARAAEERMKRVG